MPVILIANIVYFLHPILEPIKASWQLSTIIQSLLQSNDAALNQQLTGFRQFVKTASSQNGKFAKHLFLMQFCF